ncbi:MAG: 4Fe-4S cluster-binding domain-containing protein [Bacteroidales bacterium]|nr:4Fe-4S cluster-binding domain-containing protein [Bacteroidales bacterium]
MANPIKKMIRAVRQLRAMRRAPLRLEFILTDYCNLNCKGCTHYSPLAAKEFADLSRLEASMQHLGRTCATGIRDVYLIGGETLLYPALPEAMQALRRNFPTQDMYIFTNGIMLERMDDRFWEAVRNTDCIIAITRYPINFNYQHAEETCRLNGARVRIFADRADDSPFFRFALDPLKEQNGRISHFKCYNNGCISVIGSRVYPCSISGCVSHLNKACGTDFTHQDGDWLEVEKIRGVRDIQRLRNRPVPFCSYCIVPPDTVSYGPSARHISEWVETVPRHTPS